MHPEPLRFLFKNSYIRPFFFLTFILYSAFSSLTGVKPSDRLVQCIHETRIVASAREYRRCHGDALAREVVHKQFLDDLRARSTRETVGAAVAVKDAKVALRHHVEVHVQKDLVSFGLVDIRRIVSRADKTVSRAEELATAEIVMIIIIIWGIVTLRRPTRQIEPCS